MENFQVLNYRPGIRNATVKFYNNEAQIFGTVHMSQAREDSVLKINGSINGLPAGKIIYFAILLVKYLHFSFFAKKNLNSLQRNEENEKKILLIKIT